MGGLIDLVGLRFGRLVVISRAGAYGRSSPTWHCVCDCETKVEIPGRRLHSGRTQSCGCLRREMSAARLPPLPRHGLSDTPTYGTYESMLTRCYNPHREGWKNYGGRGITVCDRWRASFENFLADMGERPAGLTLERKDNDGPYSPENCIWATRSEQARNTRNTVWLNVGGERLTVSEAAREAGIKPVTLHSRLRLGWDLTKALTTPPAKEGRGAA